MIDVDTPARPLCFEYEGDHYRIAFQHAKSRAWSDHTAHPVKLVRGTTATFLWCSSCRVQLSHVPKGERARKSRCTIFSDTAPIEAEKRIWTPRFSGIGRPNEKAGDRFDRVEGCVAALRNALHPELRGEGASLPRAFRDAAWRAFHARHPAKKNEAAR